MLPENRYGAVQCKHTSNAKEMFHVEESLNRYERKHIVDCHDDTGRDSTCSINIISLLFAYRYWLEKK